jgi:serine/threonine protein phosphatase PrpC
MSIDIALVQAYLENIQVAVQHADLAHAEVLLGCMQKFLTPPAPLSFDRPMQVSVGIGLHPGIKRRGRPNEDFAFAATGVNTQTQQTYGVFAIADGMGGHANGQIASRLAIETIVDTILPTLHHACVEPSNLGSLLRDAVAHANLVIYQQNQETASLQSLDQMGTTLTALVIFGPHSCIANVGDSRAYLYRLGRGLRMITRDHSIVAELVASGAIAPEEIYTHPERNKITRCLGAAPTVEVDLFPEQVQDGDTLLLCTDGVWEMTRDPHIEKILESPWMSATGMVERLTQLALQGGGLDNIGLVVSQIHMSVPGMQTMLLCPYATVS